MKQREWFSVSARFDTANSRTVITLMFVLLFLTFPLGVWFGYRLAQANATIDRILEEVLPPRHDDPAVRTIVDRRTDDGSRRRRRVRSLGDIPVGDAVLDHATGVLTTTSRRGHLSVPGVCSNDKSLGVMPSSDLRRLPLARQLPRVHGLVAVHQKRVAPQHLGQRPGAGESV